MSHDFDVVCDRCKVARHLGQHMAARFSFGYGSNDVAGRDAAGRFIEKHVYFNECEDGDGSGGPIRIMSSDDVPEDYEIEE